MTVAELVAKISLKGGKESVATMQGLLKSTMATKVALLGAVTALYKFTEAARQQAMMLDMYQVNTGLSAEQLQKLGFNAAKAGVSMRELGGTIQHIQQMQTDFLLGKGNNSAFQWLGLDARQDPISQLNIIGQKLRYLHNTGNAALAKNFAGQLGISDSVYYAMITGTTEELSKQFIITQKEQKMLMKLNAEWNKLWFYIKQISIKFFAFTAGLQTRFLRVFTYILERATLLSERIMDMARNSKAFKNTLIGIGIAVAAVVAVFHPWLAILTAVGLILDDIFAYFQGEDSVTGAIVNWVKNSETLQGIWTAIKNIFETIRDVIKDIVAFSQTDFGKAIKDTVKNTAKAAFNPVGAAIEGVGAVKEWVVNVVQHNNVRVEAGSDAEQAGKEFVSGMNSQAANEATYQMALP